MYQVRIRLMKSSFEFLWELAYHVCFYSYIVVITGSKLKVWYMLIEVHAPWGFLNSIFQCSQHCFLRLLKALLSVNCYLTSANTPKAKVLPKLGPFPSMTLTLTSALPWSGSDAFKQILKVTFTVLLVVIGGNAGLLEPEITF